MLEIHFYVEEREVDAQQRQAKDRINGDGTETVDQWAAIVDLPIA